jgi:hypothetical protein
MSACAKKMSLDERSREQNEPNERLREENEPNERLREENEP